MKVFAVVLVALSFLTTQLDACTSFFVEGTSSAAMAKSYDWKMGHGLLVVNKKNVEKTSFAVKPDDVPVKWTSKYGSITFNQYGVEMPNGGMNEAGLAVEILWLDETVYPTPNQLPSVNEAQWIQYQLDNFSTVQEIADSIDGLRISGVYANVHYLACDKTKECITVEFLNGLPIIKNGAKVLTNDSYEQSVDHLSHFDGFGGTLPIPDDNSSLSRFVRISHQLNEFRNGQRNNVIEGSFTMLNSVRVGLVNLENTSLWNIVYDFQKMRANFVHTLVGLKKSIDFAGLDFSCKTPRKVYNIESHQGTGDISSELLNYKTSFNQRIVQLSVKDFAQKLPPGTVERLIEYPEKLNCLE
jgi:choloylglycine hydrolase